MRRRWQQVALAVSALLVLVACGGGGGGGGAPAGTGLAPPSGEPQRGGELTVLEGTFAGRWATGLDPATNTTGGANITQQAAIFGGLFRQEAADDGTGTQVVGNQAEGYELSPDGMTLTIRLREGITFTDGTPLDAEAVKFNFERDLASACSCRPTWPLTPENPVTTDGPLTVVLHFTRPYAAAINSFPASNVNWIASPTALQQMGEEAFRAKPVGAGPFKVVTNDISTRLVLERNPDYFKPGLPYLDKLTFQTIEGGDQAAYQALLAGQAQAYEGMGTVPIIDQAIASNRFAVTIQPPTSPYVVQLNTSAAPFNDQRAREAIYHATDFQAIAQGLFKGRYPASQSFTGSGGLFHHDTVEGYPAHDVERAKQLVQELGGLTVTMGTLAGPVPEQVMTALQTQWQQAGITVNIESYELATLIQEFNGKQWQAMLQTAGAWDPAAGVGVWFRFRSDSPFTGVWDPQLDAMLHEAEGTLDPDARDKVYTDTAKYIAENAYAPFGLAFAPANVAAQGVAGPGLTTKIPPIVVNSAVHWDEVWRAPQ